MSLDRVRFFSAEMQEPRFFLVLAPKMGGPPDKVLILNHGWSDRPETMLSALKLDQVYARLLAEGRVQPSLLVLPDVRFPDIFRRNSDQFPFPQYINLIAEEVARNVSAKYNIPFARDKWGIGGFSFGGYLSLDIGRRYGGRFGSISAVSTFFDEEWEFWPASPPPPGKLDSKGRGRQTIVDPGPMPKLFLACGTGDPFYGIMVQLHRKLQTLGIDHQWSTRAGAHTWSYWSTVVEGMFLFHLGHGTGQNESGIGSGGGSTR
jgi:enterochelin esterase-like enzyme